MAEVLSQGPIFILSLALILGIVVFIHELGHYYAGRWFGAAVESFSIGFGKPIFERTDRRGTRWRINWIPLGGFVKFVGESQLPNDVGVVEVGPKGKPYADLGVGARSVVALAGPVANFLLAIMLFALMFWVNGMVQSRITLVDVADGQPAAQAGLQVGDILDSINGQPITSTGDIAMNVVYATGVPLEVVVTRNGEQVSTTVVPERVVRENEVGQMVPQGTIGVLLQTLPDSTTRRYPGPIEALGIGAQRTGQVLSLTTRMLGRIVTGKEPIDTLTGPIGIGDIGRRVVNRTMGITEVPLWNRVQALFWQMISICAAISVGVGFFNLLPLPVLDGGHLVFNAYEAVTGKVLPEKVQEVALMAGLCLLLTMFVFITWGDIIETGLFSRSAG